MKQVSYNCWQLDDSEKHLLNNNTDVTKVVSVDFAQIELRVLAQMLGGSEKID